MPDKKIEDYLHLYLGCECDYQGDVGTMYEVTTHGCRISGVFAGGFIGFGLCKPILRPLSDMSEEETHEYRKIWLTVGSDGVFDYVDTPESFLWLLSLHFDLFNLIPKYAIDKTTLK